jgi:hypothetical protein
MTHGDLGALLGEGRIATLRALLDSLIPPDDAPGAWDAGVGDYLARQFAGDLAGEREHYAVGLDALDAEARFRHGMAFAALAPRVRAEVLRQLEQDATATAWPIDAAAFVRAAAEHAAEGYYSDPGNGGNRDGVAWRMIGFVVTD